MLYIALSFVVLLLGLLTFIEWRKSRGLSRHGLTKLHRRIHEHLSLGQFEAAEKLLKRRGDEMTAVLRIKLMRKTRRFEEALKAIEELDQSNHTSLFVLREKGKILLAQGDCAGALTHFLRCRPVLRDEDDLMELASAYYGEDRILEAWQTIETLLEDSKHGQLLSLGGNCCFARSDYERALSLYRRAYEADHNNAQVLARTGHCLRRLFRFKEAEECFVHLLQRDPKNVAATLSLGACLEAQGLYTKAMAIYQHGHAWESGDPRILRQAGICAVHVRRFDLSELYLKDAIDRGHCSAQILAFLGYTLERQQKWQGAEAIYHRLTKEYPDHIAGPRGLAWLYGVGLSRKLDASMGLAMAKQSVDLLPDPISWETLSACQARAGNFIEAHNIQEYLSAQGEDRNTQRRRKQAMRALRQRRPLDEHLVARALVA